MGIEVIRRWFHTRESSGEVAKRRLEIVLSTNRTGISPDIMEALKEDLIEVLSRYMVIDRDSIETKLERSDNAVALVSSVEVKKVLRLNAARN